VGSKLGFDFHIRERENQLPFLQGLIDQIGRELFGLFFHLFAVIFLIDYGVAAEIFRRAICFSIPAGGIYPDRSIPGRWIFGFTVPPVSAVTSRNIPATRYADICGQDEALKLVRDYAELPLLHPELFQHVGVKPGRGILNQGLRQVHIIS
ncbi:MAG: hypothetical protein HZA78_05270, partial [Candidatus Schekmanbacteria bacterium]|nr:hypothetical protein [Candidatus Schekmanbacteria bacterium]